jgi:thiamine pyrophosphokinase
MLEKQKHSEKPFMTCIVVGPMNFSWKVIKKHIKNPETQIYFIDGGLIHYEKFKKHFPKIASKGSKSAMSFGDGDSSQKAMTKKKTDQNISDLAFFLKNAPSNLAVESFLFVGFLGGRIDHELFNLGEIANFVGKWRMKHPPMLWMEDKIQFLSKGSHSLNILGHFSIASFSENKIFLKGDCLYKSKTWIKLSTLSSRGLSNEGHGTVEIKNQAVVALLYS